MGADILAKKGVEEIYVGRGDLGLTNCELNEIDAVIDDKISEIVEYEMKLFYDRRDMSYNQFKECIEGIEKLTTELEKLRMIEKFVVDGWKVEISK